MKTKSEIIQSDIPDFVEEHDIFGLVKSKRIEVHKTSKSILKITVPKLNLNYASFGERLNAFLIDIIILFALLSVLDMLTKTVLPTYSSIQIQDIVIVALIWIMYNSIFECSKFQTTIGELILKIKVVDIQGKRLKFITSLSRSIVDCQEV